MTVTFSYIFSAMANVLMVGDIGQRKAKALRKFSDLILGIYVIGKSKNFRFTWSGCVE